ncbi:MAG: hypothetical protein IKT33_00460 [Clostridia bacterium]|nr:hypothetical protein [Clostridia bacterium]
MQISISIEPYLTAEKKRLQKYIEEIVQLSRQMSLMNHELSLHFDYFKSNPEVFKLVQSYTSEIKIDLHLMQEPVNSLDGFRSVSFDAEDLKQQKCELVSKVQDERRGLVLDLGYRVADYKDLIKQVSYIILMSVKCGKSGQVFQESVLSLVREIRMINPSVIVIIDGGVNENNIKMIQKEGIDVVVVGSYAKKCYETGEFEQGINRLLHV